MRRFIAFIGVLVVVTTASAQGRRGGGQETKIVKQFDKNDDGWLNAEERKAARAGMSSQGFRGGGGGRGRGGPPGGFGGQGDGSSSSAKGQTLAPKDVKNYPDTGLYDEKVLRTFFFTFEDADWEREMEDFHGTDVDVPATLVVDGKTYRDVGLSFRGNSSYGMVPAGAKRSLNVSVSMAHDKQTLGGYRSLNLLNSHEDASMMRAVLYSHVAQQLLPAPKANFVRVVINGESWGVYQNVEQINKDFLKENYKETDGARWKIPGSPGASGGLEYWGDNVDSYKQVFQIKTKDDPAQWAALINLTKVLNETPAAQLEKALDPILDIDGALRFLAADIAVVNGDGYWTRQSDYSLYRDTKGKFHIIPYDMNEAFSNGGGPGGRGGGGGRGGPGGFDGPGGFGGPDDFFPPDFGPGGPGGRGGGGGGRGRGGRGALDSAPAGSAQNVALAQRGGRGGGRGGQDFGPGGPGDRGGRGGGPGGFGGGSNVDPLSGLQDSSKPLRSKLLAVPALREKYLAYVREIATKAFDPKAVNPVIEQYQKLIDADVKTDTKKLDTYEAFVAATGSDNRSLKSFIAARREYLLR